MDNKDEMIKEEQKILSKLIRKLDEIMVKTEKVISKKELEAQKAKSQYLPEAYADLVRANNDSKRAKEEKNTLLKTKHQLYETRIEVKADDSDDVEEIKIGLNNFTYNGVIYIYNWLTPMCRHYMLNDASVDYEYDFVDEHGQEYKTNYTLKKKRRITMDFDEVTSVEQYYPLIQDDGDNLVYDPFLRELLERRNEKEFKNIVFSIQKEQGKIISQKYEENIIVQGCAGSGKSMIMFHRLPVLMYDNEVLNENNIYIIIPSESYAQLSSRLREDLNIDYLKMSTISEYYDYIITNRYRIKDKPYSKIQYSLSIPKKNEIYIYSDKLVELIKKYMNKCLVKKKSEYIKVMQLINQKFVYESNSNLKSDLELIIRNVDGIIKNANDEFKRLRNAFSSLGKRAESQSDLLKNMKSRAMNNINDRIYELEDKLAYNRKRLKRVKDGGAAHQKYTNEIEYLLEVIEKSKIARETIENSDVYGDYLAASRKLERIAELTRVALTVSDNYNDDVFYNDIYREIKAVYKEFCDKVSSIEDEFKEYSGNEYSAVILDESVEEVFESLVSVESLETMSCLNEIKVYYNYLYGNIVTDTFIHVVKAVKLWNEKKDKLIAASCVPYIYLQILYNFQGRSNTWGDSLIAIDEAQNLSVEEYALIKAQNPKATFNLYGDINQHVEGSKGIDRWDDIDSYSDYTTFLLNENYRNAKQITVFSNKEFHMDMKAINLNGAGVHVNDKNFDEFVKSIVRNNVKAGNKAIIFKSRDEAKSFLMNDSVTSDRVNNVLASDGYLDGSRWNVITVDQAKGLEFGTVCVFAARMTTNEKYIAYTRALDELFICEEEIDISSVISKKRIDLDEQSVKNVPVREPRVQRKKRKRKTAVKVKGLNLLQFYEQNGVDTIDLRNDSGYLWVVGKREEIADVVAESVRLYNITGEYSSSRKHRINEGWCTKSTK
ncbi:MAG: AAA family ATPase [Lachnospiraceae bacterium]|nr:AAA family ATPase [Lachnospiraceae bacterium]